MAHAKSDTIEDRSEAGFKAPDSQPALGREDAPVARPSRDGGGRARRGDVIMLVNQMGVMLDTGVPLSTALRSIADRAADLRFKRVLTTVTDSVEAGEPFSSALGRHPRAFPPIMVALLRASEASGTMSTMLNRIAAYLTKEHQMMRQVRGALMYPAFMFLMCVGITVLLLTVVLPRFTSIYANKQTILPAPTRFLMAISDGLASHWYWWLIGIVMLVVMMMLWARTAVGRSQFDWIKLRAPLSANLMGKLLLSRSCRTIATLVESGVSLLETVSIVKDVTRNTYYERLWDQVDMDLREGRPLSEPLHQSWLIPDHVAQMVEAGERSGQLGKVFARVADFTETEYDQVVKNTTQFIEPIMIVVMGSIIGFIAIALLIPIFSVGRVVSGG